MTERDRIETLFEEGRITREQADGLLEALEETYAAEQETEAAGRVADLAGQRPEEKSENWVDEIAREVSQSVAGVGKRVSEEIGRAFSRTERESRFGNEVGKWLEVSLLAGNLDITVDASLDRPVVREQDAAVEMHDGGARIRQWADGDGSGGFLDRLVRGAQKSDLDVAIPAGWGIDLDIKGGEATIGGAVPFVRGRMSAGNLRIRDTAGIDVTVAAGELRAGLRISRGEHRAEVKVGSARLSFLPGSSVEIDGRVSIGSIAGGKGVEVSSQGGIGGSVRATVANQPASAERGSLAIKVSTGDLRLETADA